MSNAVALHDQAPPRLPTLTAGAPIRAIVPQDFEGAWRIATAVVRAGMAPRGLDTVEKSMVAIMHGLEVGLTPMNALQSIAVVNGRPTVWGDGAIGLARGSGLLEWMEETYEGEEGSDAFKAVCRVKRKGEPRPVEGEFSVADAKVSGLWTKRGRDGQPTPWQQYPKRMLKMRARAFALRDGFADVLKGLAIKEEVEDYHNATLAPRDEPPAPPPAQIEQAAEATPVTPAEDLVHVTDQAETVEWTEPEQQEAAPADEPPAPPAAVVGTTESPTGQTASDEVVDDFPGDKPLPKAVDTGIPAFLDRRKHPELNAPVDEVNVEDWLKGLEGALSGCESTEQLVEVQNKYQSPMRGKVSKADFARSQSMVMETFTRISEQDGE